MAASPVLLDYLESSVVDFSEEPLGEYDPVSQVFRYSQTITGATSKTQSYQNSTTSPNVLTGCEDYDDQYVTTPD